MTTEKLLWAEVFAGLKGLHGTNIDLVRHEDAVSPGTPDLSYGLAGVNGWLELKIGLVTRQGGMARPQDSWLKARDMRAQQLRFLQERGRTGGHCFVLLRAVFRDGERLTAVFDHHQAPELNTARPLDAWSRRWEAAWWGDISYPHLSDVLTRPATTVGTTPR